MNCVHLIIPRPHLSDVSVAVAHPDVLESVGVEAEGGRGAGELQPRPRLPDGYRGEEVGGRVSILPRGEGYRLFSSTRVSG